MFPDQLADGACAVVPQAGVIQRGAADLDHDFQFRPSRWSHPNMRFRFCTAWPAAPFRRLSRQETITSRSPSGERAKPMSQKLVRAEYWICGNLSPKTRTQGLPA